MRLWLLNIQTKDNTVTYKDQYKLYPEDKLDDAVRHAEEHGAQFMFGIKPTVGMKHVYSCGNINVELILVEVERG